MKRLAVLLALALAATACPRTRATVVESPTGSPRPPSVEVVAQNLRLLSDASRPLRVGFSAAEPTVRVIVTYPDTGAIVAACALGSADATPPNSLPEPECLSELPSGVREELSSSSRIAGIAIWVRSGDPVTANVRVEFAEGARPRPVRFVLPLLPAPSSPSACKDNACNPLIEVKPERGGPFSARASWSGGVARLALLQGRLLAKSFTATGLPYAIPAQQRNANSASIEARMSAPGEYGLVVDSNAADLTDVVIESRWP